MNGTIKNWVAHFGLGLVIALGFGYAFQPVVGGLMAVEYFWIKEVGEFSAKHWDAKGRPLADFNPFNHHRTLDDRLDLLSGLLGGIVGAVVSGFLS